LNVAIVDVDYVAAESRRPWRYRKALVLQPDVVVLGSRRPIACESPLDADTSGPAKIAAAAAGE
jgi:hypothetical protein